MNADWMGKKRLHEELCDYHDQVQATALFNEVMQARGRDE